MTAALTNQDAWEDVVYSHPAVFGCAVVHELDGTVSVVVFRVGEPDFHGPAASSEVDAWAACAAALTGAEA
jgi:hypothetical protein